MVLLGDQFAGKRVVKTVEDKLHHAEKRADRVLVQRVDLVGVAQRRLLDVFVGNLHVDHVQDVVQVELDAIVERLRNRPRKQLVRELLASLGYVRPDLLLKHHAGGRCLVRQRIRLLEERVPERGGSGLVSGVAVLRLLAIRHHLS